MKIPNKSLARTYGRQGMQACIEKNYRSAYLHFTMAINHDDTDADYYAGRATVSCHQEGYQEALIDINKAISLNPDDKNLYNLRGCILGNMGKTEQAADDFKRGGADPYSFALNFMALMSMVKGGKDA